MLDSVACSELVIEGGLDKDVVVVDDFVDVVLVLVVVCEFVPKPSVGVGIPLGALEPVDVERNDIVTVVKEPV